MQKMSATMDKMAEQVFEKVQEKLRGATGANLREEYAAFRAKREKEQADAAKAAKAKG